MVSESNSSRGLLSMSSFDIRNRRVLGHCELGRRGCEEARGPEATSGLGGRSAKGLVG